MSNLAELIKDLETEGKLDSVGDFTLDKKKAREKMKKYQLVDPHYYVLELVQAAVASGATYIDFYIDSDDCMITFDGENYTKDDLENMYSSLFMSQSDYTLDRYRELAIGVNSALALNPQFIKIISGDDEGTVQLEIAPPNKEIMVDAEESFKGTKIHVKDRMSWRVASRFLAKAIASKLPTEAKVLKEKCIYCRVPITVNKENINNEKQLDLQNVLTQVHPDWEEIKGSMGIPRTPYKLSHIEFVKWGVKINSRHLKLSSIPLIGVVEANRLIKNVSQSDIVENDVFKETLKQLKSVTDEIVMKLAEDFEDIDPVVDDQGKKLSQEYLMQAVESDFTIRKYKYKPTKLRKKLAEVRMFEVTCGNFDYKDRFVNLDTLIKQYEEIGYVPFSKKAFYEEHPEKLIVVYSRNEKMFNLLNRIFNHQTQDVVEDFNRKAIRDRNIKMWESKKGSPLTMIYDTVYHTEFAQDDIEAKIGLMLRKPDKYSRIKFFIQKGYICELSVELKGLFFDAVLNNDKLKPVFTWDDVNRGEEFIRSLNALISHTPALYLEASKIYEKLSPEERNTSNNLRIHLLRYINFVLPERNKDEKAGSKDEAVDDSSSQHRIICKIKHEITGSKASYNKKLKNEVVIPHPNFVLTDKFIDLPLFETVRGDIVSLRDLEKDLEKYFKVHFVSKKMSTKQMDDRHVVIALDEELSVLTKYFGWYKLDNYEKGLIQEQQAIKNLNRPTEKAIIWEDTLGKVEIKDSGFIGELGLLKAEDMVSYSYEYTKSGKVPTGQVHVKILKHYRHIATKKIDIPLHGVFAVVNCDQFNVNRAWNDIFEDEKYEEFKKTLQKSLNELAMQFLDPKKKDPGLPKGKVERFLLQYAGYFLGRLDYETKEQKDNEAREAIKSYPFFKTTDGRGLLNFDRVMEEKKKFGGIAFVDKNIEGSLDNDRSVLILNPLEMSVIKDVMGTNSLENVETILKEKRISEYARKNRPISEPKISQADVLIKIPVEHDEMKGEVALTRFNYLSRGLSVSTVQLLKENRLVVNKQVQLPVQVIASVNYDKLSPNYNWTDINKDEHLEEVFNTLRASIFKLIKKLYENIDSLSPADTPHVSRHVLSFLINSFSCFADIKRAKPGSFINKLAVLPIFTTVNDRKVSFLDIIEDYEKTDSIKYINHVMSQRLLDPDMIVLILNQRQLELLKKHFFHFNEYSDELEKEKIVLRNMNKKPVENLVVENAYITKLPVNKKGIKGEIAIPDEIPSQRGITFAKRMLPVVTKPLFTGSLVFGILDSVDFKTDDTFTDVVLLGNEKRLILESIYRLYQKLMGKYNSIEDTAQKETARKILLEFYYNQKNKVESEYNILDGKLENSLVSLPLLPIADGRYVNLEEAIEEVERLGYLPYILKYEALAESSADIVFRFEMFDFDFKYCQKMFGSKRLKNYNEIVKIALMKEQEEKLRKERAILYQEKLQQKKQGDEQKKMEIQEKLNDFEAKRREKIIEEKELLQKYKEKKSPVETVYDESIQKAYKERILIPSEPVTKLPPEKQLLFAVKREFRIIREVGDYKLSDKVLRDMMIIDLEGKPSITFDKKKQLLTINSSDPFIKSIMDKLSDNKELIYYLLSVIYSTINKELLEITDEDEMRFQNVMLENLLKYSV